MTRCLPPSHQVVDHTAEIVLRVRAASLGELLAEAGRALAEIQLVGADCLPGGPVRRLQVAAPDRAALLAEWLNELIVLAEAERWVAMEFTIDRATDQEVVARVSGVTLERAPTRVKAATLHGLQVVEVPGGLEAEVRLDV